MTFFQQRFVFQYFIVKKLYQPDSLFKFIFIIKNCFHGSKVYITFLFLFIRVQSITESARFTAVLEPGKQTLFLLTFNSIKNKTHLSYIDW